MKANKDLNQYLADFPIHKPFVPYCQYDKEDDSLTFYFAGDADFSDRINSHITVYRSMETRAIIGCRVKGVADILKDLPNYISVQGEDGGIALSVFFLAFRGGAEGEARNVVNDLGKAAANAKLELCDSH